MNLYLSEHCFIKVFIGKAKQKKSFFQQKAFIFLQFLPSINENHWLYYKVSSLKLRVFFLLVVIMIRKCVGIRVLHETLGNFSTLQTHKQLRVAACVLLL